MPDLSRTLSVYVDGGIMEDVNRIQLTGADSVGLYPMPFTLRLWNLSDSDYYLLRAAGEVSVAHGDSVLASGTISDVCRYAVPEGTVTEIVLSAGIRFWEAPVSLSVEAGVSVSETVRRILADSGTGITLLSFPGEDPVRTRGQAFFGRAAECAEEALSAAGARVCLSPAGLCVIPSSGLPVSMELSEEDLLDAPERAGGNLLLLRTKPVGWPLGKMISVAWEGETWTGLVTERSIDADNMEGKWQAELLVQIHNS